MVGEKKVPGTPQGSLRSFLSDATESPVEDFDVQANESNINSGSTSHYKPSSSHYYLLWCLSTPWGQYTKGLQRERASCVDSRVAHRRVGQQVVKQHSFILKQRFFHV